MKSSTSLGLKGVIFDANVLSLLAKEGHLELLPQFFALPRYITPEIQSELEAGLRNGVSYLRDVLQRVAEGHLKVVSPTATEKQAVSHLPPKLGRGEAEAIAVCQQRKLSFITHDRKAANYCDRAGIACIRLRALLIALQKAGLLTASEVKKILAEE
jgi:predicted nucleic acid-binding protein